MKHLKVAFIGCGIALVVFYLTASGCTWITLTANNQIAGLVTVPGLSVVKSVYLNVHKCVCRDGADVSDSCEKFLKIVSAKVVENGVILAASEQQADLTVKMDLTFYSKKSGIKYFFLGVIPWMILSWGIWYIRASRWILSLKESRALFRKRYRFYDEGTGKYLAFARALLLDLESGRK